MTCAWCSRPPIDHSLEEARLCLELIALRDDDASRRGEVPGDVRAARTVNEWHFCGSRLTLTIELVSDAVAGRLLRAQRHAGGFSVKAIAVAASLSPTRIRDIEAADRVTLRATSVYLRGLTEAWSARAAEAALIERQTERDDAARELVIR